MFLAQETNTAWTPLMTHAIQAQCHQVYCHKNGKYLESRPNWLPIPTRRNNDPCTWQMVSWIINWGHNALLGCWSYLKLVGQNMHHCDVCILSMPTTIWCNLTHGYHTAILLLLQQGIPHLNPKNNPSLTSSSCSNNGNMKANKYHLAWMPTIMWTAQHHKYHVYLPMLT